MVYRHEEDLTASEPCTLPQPFAFASELLSWRIGYSCASWTWLLGMLVDVETDAAGFEGFDRLLSGWAGGFLKRSAMLFLGLLCALGGRIGPGAAVFPLSC